MHIFVRYKHKTKENVPFEIDVPVDATETPKSTQEMPANVNREEGFYVQADELSLGKY